MKPLMHVLLFGTACLASLVAAAEMNKNQIIAAAVLPLPEGLRDEATVVSYESDQKLITLRKGLNGMICTADRPGDDMFYVNCFHESVFPLLRRARELREAQPNGSPATHDVVTRALDEEIKAGKWKVPSKPTMGFQMRGPASAYNFATNTASDEIKRWEMVMIPYVTGQALSLPEKRQGNMPWVMEAGSWAAHIMIEH